jgi:hypothetical protein
VLLVLSYVKPHGASSGFSMFQILFEISQGGKLMKLTRFLRADADERVLDKN